MNRVGPAQGQGSIASTVLFCLVFALAVLSAFVYSVTRESVASVEELSAAGVIVWPTPRALNPFELELATGGLFTNVNLEGRWSFLYFGFTNCPDICPTSLAAMAKARGQLEAEAPELAKAFQGVFVSVDPERDSAERVEAYVGAFNAEFLGARGSREAVAALATDVNVAFAKVPSAEGPYAIDHTGNIVIINPRGHYHGFVKLPHEAATLVTAARAVAATF